MKTMKKFWKYFINFVVLFLLVSGLTYLGTMNMNKKEKQTSSKELSNENVMSVETEP